MGTITIMDPVTRIEGHMKVELDIDGGYIKDARCTGTLFRGFEILLQGRDPWDAPVITQRICGVCPISHAEAAVLALDNAAKGTVPTNARLLRNLTLGANFIQSHILHFYLLAALDYVKGPQVSPWIPAWENGLSENLGQVVEHLAGPALVARREAHEMGAIFGGKMPTSHAYIPGGFTATPSRDKITLYREYLTRLIAFINNAYLPDVDAVAAAFPNYRHIGQGYGNLMAYGVFELDETGENKLLNQGYVQNGATGEPGDVNHGDITEFVNYSWYEDGNNALTPAQGETTPQYPKGDAYSWLKAPRLLEQPFEVGALARMWVNGDYQKGISVMDRHLARAGETLKIAEAMNNWLDELDPGAPAFDGYSLPKNASGAGMTEAPRGALGHWIEISEGKISHYQVITPTCWNASPKDGKGIPGPMEQALIGTPVEDSNQPIEALRVIHSFDPCLSCAVHITRPGGEPVIVRAGIR